MKSILAVVILTANFLSHCLNVTFMAYTLAIAWTRSHMVVNKSLRNRMLLIFSRSRIGYGKSALLFVNLIIGHGLLLISLQSNAKEGELKEKFITCLDGRAIALPLSQPFGGAYIRCEDFDLFYESLERGDLSGARSLLLTQPKVKDGEGKIKKKYRRENFFQCTEIVTEEEMA